MVRRRPPDRVETCWWAPSGCVWYPLLWPRPLWSFGLWDPRGKATVGSDAVGAQSPLPAAGHLPTCSHSLWVWAGDASPHPFSSPDLDPVQLLWEHQSHCPVAMYLPLLLLCQEVEQSKRVISFVTPTPEVFSAQLFVDYIMQVWKRINISP